MRKLQQVARRSHDNMPNSLQHVLICYGDQVGYHHGAKYQILRGYHHIKSNSVCVITDRPDLFEGYPVRILPLNAQQENKWTLDGQDHFGIKLQGLLWAIESADRHISKSILLDTDMYWTKNPNKLKAFIDSNTVALYQDEGLIIGSRNKSIQQFEHSLRGREIKCEGYSYTLTELSRMWGSAIIGLDHANKQILREAFQLFERLSPLVKAHTTEQFALAEIIRRHQLTRIASKTYVHDWSSIGKKVHATPELAAFFQEYGEHDFERHLNNFRQIKIKRPLSTFLKQKIERWKRKLSQS